MRYGLSQCIHLVWLNQCVYRQRWRQFCIFIFVLPDDWTAETKICINIWKQSLCNLCDEEWFMNAIKGADGNYINIYIYFKRIRIFLIVLICTFSCSIYRHFDMDSHTHRPHCPTIPFKNCWPLAINPVHCECILLANIDVVFKIRNHIRHNNLKIV